MVSLVSWEVCIFCILRRTVFRCRGNLSQTNPSFNPTKHTEALKLWQQLVFHHMYDCSAVLSFTSEIKTNYIYWPLTIFWICSSCLIFVTKPRTDGSQMEIMARCVCNLRLVDTWPTQSARWLWPCHSLIKVLKTFHITVIKKCSGTFSMKLCQPHISKCKMYLGE